MRKSVILKYPNKFSDIKNCILVIGLNPALQKSLIFSEFVYGEVNRAERVTYTVGGKGANFSRAAGNWGARTLLCQIVGGDTGKYICNHLRSEKIYFLAAIHERSTRTCTTCLCRKTGIMTELIEPGENVDSHELVEILRDEIKELLPTSVGVALCGTFPPGIKGKFYADIAKAANELNIPVLLDGYKDVRDTLAIGVNILKININELKNITETNSLHEGANLIFNDFNVNILAVTDGPRTSYMIEKEGMKKKFDLPILSNIVNPLGAGDTVDAVFFAEYLKAKPLAEAFKLGLAAGSASCLSLYPGVFCKDDVMEIAENIRVSDF